VSIMPRNAASLRVVEKLGLRSEGVAQGYIQIAGVWEDHERFGLTLEEWQARRDEMTARLRAARNDGIAQSSGSDSHS